MNTHFPPGARAARSLPGWTQEMLAGKALVAPTALKRLESEMGSRCERTRLGLVPRRCSRCIGPW